MKRTGFFSVGIICIVVILTVIQIVISNSLSTKGVSLGKLEDQLHSYEIDNAMLREKLLQYASFTNIASRAAEQGFVPHKSQVVYSSPLPLAVKQ